MRPIHWLAIVAAALGWSSGGIATRAALDDGVGEWTMVAMRILFAAVLVLAILWARSTSMPSILVLRYGLVQAVFNLTVPYLFMTFALGEASAGFVGVVAGLIPLSTALFASRMLTDEPLTLPKLVALFVAFTGVALLLLSGDSGLSEGGRPALAVAYALTAVASIGFANTFGRKHSGAYDPTTITGVQFAFAAVWMVGAMMAIEGVPTDVSALGWVLIVEMSVFATVVPFLLLYWLLQRISATNTSLTGYLVPFFGLVGGIVILGEELQPGIVVGGILVLAGLVLADRASRRHIGLDIVEVSEPA